MSMFIFVFFILLVSLFALLPFWFIYLLSDLFYLLFFYIIRYRRKVMHDNLLKCFPKKTKDEILILEKKTYKNLIDILIEGIKGFSMRPAQINKRHKVLNPEFIKSYPNQAIIACTAHYANWEWGTFSASLQTNLKVFGFYKPLSNKYIDRFLRWSRARYGTELVSIGLTTRTFDSNKDKSVAIIMAADQSPTRPEKSYWINFMGQDTAFLHGPEKHARRCGLVVMYAAVRRVKRGYYTIELSLLTNDIHSLPDGELTRLYAEKVESEINNNPSDWLWSHRRWKHKREIGV